MTRVPPPELAAAEARPGRVLSVAELGVLGVSRSTADRRVAGGQWRRLASGLYVVGRGAPEQAGLARGAQSYGGANALVSGLLAASAHGMRWVPPALKALLLIDGERRLRSTELITVRRCAGLADLGRWQRDGVAYAPADRTVVDAAMQLSELQAVRGVVLGAVADRRTTVDALNQVLLGEPRNGTGLLRRALRDASRGCASPPEAELVDALIGCGFPFLVNAEIHVEDVLIGIADVWFVGLGCGSEMDSRERHDGDDAFDETLSRHDRFGGYGLVLSHLTPRRLRRGPAAAVGAALAVARSRLALPAGLREPPGLRVVRRGPLLR